MMKVERAAYIVVGLLAAGLRFFQLGVRPLNEAEAVQALAAFRFVQGGGGAVPAGTLPALFTGNLVGFTLLGASDMSARWLPALAGVILVLLPYGLRHRLGRVGALAASFLLAISPSAVYFSRSLDSAIPVATCGLAMVVGLIAYLDTRRPGYLYLLAAGVGLGLCAGPGIYTLLLIPVAFALLLFLGARLLGRNAGWSSLMVAWQTARSQESLLARTGAVVVATFGLVAMAFVLHPAGVGHAADLIGAWASGFLPELGGQPFFYPVLLLLHYEALILVLGLVEIGCWLVRPSRGVWQQSAEQEAVEFGSSFPHTAFLTFWTVVAGFLLLVMGHRPAGNILWIVVPLALLAGQGVERAWRWIGQAERRQGRGLWFEAAVFALIALGVIIFLYLQATAYSLSSSAATVSIAGITLYASSTYLLLAMVALVLLVGLGVVAWLWRGPAMVVIGAWLALVTVLGLFGFKATWTVNVAHASDARELMILHTTVPDVRLLVERLQALSLDKSGDAHTLPFTVDAATGPVVAWYLRDFSRQSVTEGLSTPPDTAVAVTLAAQDLPIGETFRGQGFPLRTYWLPWPDGSGWTVWRQQLVRWLLFTDASLPAVDQEVVLWVASEP
jgi:uncharacterized protein (TIGR03663 family)